MSAVLDEAKKRLDDALASLEGAIIRSELRGPSSDKYEAELDALRSDRARLAEQIDSAKAEIRQLSEVNESTKAETSRMLELDAARIRALEADLASLEGEKGRMSAEVDSVRAEVQRLSEQNAKASSLAEKPRHSRLSWRRQEPKGPSSPNSLKRQKRKSGIWPP